jgi:Fe2+ or Zn2+ uptake regulation protein
MSKGLFKNFFREKKVRMSHPRLLVYQELFNATRPLSLQELYQGLLKKRKGLGSLPSIDLLIFSNPWEWSSKSLMGQI